MKKPAAYHPHVGSYSVEVQSQRVERSEEQHKKMGEK